MKGRILISQTPPMSSSQMERAERVIRAFSAFDGEKTGKVRTEAMQHLLQSIGTPLTPNEAKEFVTDADEGGWIDYRRFVLTVMFAS